FSYSESFDPVSGSNSRGQPFDPSRGKQYEAGVKYVPKDMPVVVTAAVYQLTKDKNLTADPANQAFSIQTGEIRSRIYVDSVSCVAPLARSRSRDGAHA
ncbi:TonB-dependent receptor, partial [Mycobacterium tuberculosis]|nr:TonB-dependent receptor [Mycobacterium tuberculosis]